MAAAHRLYREAGFVDIPPYHDLGVPGIATLGLRLYRFRGSVGVAATPLMGCTLPTPT
jgi:hypothetical protein